MRGAVLLSLVLANLIRDGKSFTGRALLVRRLPVALGTSQGAQNLGREHTMQRTGQDGFFGPETCKAGSLQRRALVAMKSISLHRGRIRWVGFGQGTRGAPLSSQSDVYQARHGW